MKHFTKAHFSKRLLGEAGELGQLINECTYITLFKVVDLKYIIHWSGCGKKIPWINST